MESEAKTPVKQTLGLSAYSQEAFTEMFKLVQDYALRINEEKGWHSPEPTDAECVANVHGEVSELNEWMRQGAKVAGHINIVVESDHIAPFTGIEEEGADVIIRLMSWYRRRGWRLAEAILEKLKYNAARPHRHGGKSY